MRKKLCSGWVLLRFNLDLSIIVFICLVASHVLAVRGNWLIHSKQKLGIHRNYEFTESSSRQFKIMIQQYLNIWSPPAHFSGALRKPQCHHKLTRNNPTDSSTNTNGYIRTNLLDVNELKNESEIYLAFNFNLSTLIANILFKAPMKLNRIVMDLI